VKEQLAMLHGSQSADISPKIGNHVCEGFSPVSATSHDASAEILATRAARRSFGKADVVASVALQSPPKVTPRIAESTPIPLLLAVVSVTGRFQDTTIGW
jgi:hypothetical protein